MYRRAVEPTTVCGFERRPNAALDCRNTLRQAGLLATTTDCVRRSLLAGAATERGRNRRWPGSRIAVSLVPVGLNHGPHPYQECGKT
jgi:hypothetical protein